MTFSVNFGAADGNSDTVWVELDDSDVLQPSLSVNSASTNDTDGIASSANLVDGADGDGVDDTIKFELSDADGPKNVTVDFDATYAGSTNALSGTVYVGDSSQGSGITSNASFPTLVSLSSDSSADTFNSPLPQGLTDNTPTAQTSPGASQVIADLSFGTAGEVDNVTVNATGGNVGDIGPGSIDSITVDLYDGSSVVSSTATSYDSHNTTVTPTNVTGVDRILVTANLASTATGKIDADVFVQANPTAGVNTQGFQSISAQTGFISGRVSDTNNNDIENATVVVQNSTLGFQKNTTTNANGDYTIEVPKGTYDVFAQKPAFSTAQPKDTTVQENATTTANFVLQRLLFPVNIDVTPSSAQEFIGNQITYTTTVFDQDGDPLDNVDVQASVNNNNIQFVGGSTATTGSNGEATFTVTSGVLASGTLTFEAINGSGPNPTTTATASFVPQSGNGTVIGNVFNAVNDTDHGLEDATVWAVEKNRALSNSIAVPTPQVVGNTSFYRVVDNSTGEIVDHNDYRVDNDGQNAAIQIITIREHNVTNSSFGSGFAIRAKQTTPSDAFVTPLEPGNYTIQESQNQPNASDTRFSNVSGVTDAFYNVSTGTAPENLTSANAEQLSQITGSQLVDQTDAEGKYVLDYLFADGQEGVDYQLTAEKVGFERDFVDATVTADGALFESGEDENFVLRPREVDPGQVDITQIGLHPPLSETGGAPDPTQITFFPNLTDEYAQQVPRDGETVDVVEVESLTDDGGLVNATVEVGVEDFAAFDGNWSSNYVIGGTLVDATPALDQITVNTGSDGVARLLLFADSASGDLTTNKTAVLTNDRSATDNTTVEFVGQINFQGAAISGIVTDTNDDPIQDSIVYAEQFTLPTDASTTNNIGPSSQTRFTVEPNGGVTATAVDDDSDLFTVTRQAWNTTTLQWEDAVSNTATRSALKNYRFSNFTGVSINLSSNDGFKLVDEVELGGGQDPDASYTLDPLPTVPTQTGAASTDYVVRGVKLSQPNRSATRAGGASVQPGFTDDANIVLPIDVQQADLQVTNLQAPAQTPPGSNITVTADITNTGGALGQTQQVEFAIDTTGDGTLDTVLRFFTVDVDPGDTESVSFSASTSGLAPGTYTHGVSTNDDTDTAQLQIVGQPTFNVSGLSAPASAVQGDVVNVTATVTNTGNVQGSDTVEFRLGGSTVSSTSVSLGAGASQQVQFTPATSNLAPGNYTHGVFTSDDNQTANLEVLAPANFQITSLNSPANISQGDTLNVSAEVENVGGAPGTSPVSLNINGTNVSTGTGSVDIVFAIDTSGSMSNEISAVQNGLQTFTNTLQSQGIDVRYAVITFADQVPYNVRQNYTANVTQTQQTINAITTSGAIERSFDTINDSIDMFNERANADEYFIVFTDEDSDTEGSGDALGTTPSASDLVNRVDSEDISLFAVTPPETQVGNASLGVSLVANNSADGQFFNIAEGNFSAKFENQIAGAIANASAGQTVTLNASASTTAPFSIDTSNLAPGNYTIEASTDDDNASAPLAVTSGSIVDQYDANNDGAIDIGELGDAASDYAAGQLTIGELGDVAAAYASS